MSTPPGYTAYKVNDVDRIFIPDSAGPEAGPSLLVYGALNLTTLGGGEQPTVLFLPPGWTSGQAQVPQLGPRAKRRYRLQNLTVTQYAGPGNGQIITYIVKAGAVFTPLFVGLVSNAAGEASDTVDTYDCFSDDIIAIGVSSQFDIGNGNVNAIATLEIKPI